MEPDTPPTGAPPETFANRGIREAIQLLREYGVTPEQYATVRLVEEWSFDDQRYPDRESAFAAARQRASDTSEWVEVWLTYGPDAAGAESWIVHPDGSTR